MSPHQCPTCTREFDTRRGLGVHHVHAHDERLPNRECAHCGTEFYSDWARKFCSKDCLLESGTFAGKNNPNYMGGKTNTTCQICGIEFSYYPSDKKGLYCSDCVQNEDWYPKPDVSGKNNPRWIGGKQEYRCTVCSDTVKRYPSNAEGEGITCSEDCRRTWLSDSFTGEGHPNWKGGTNEPYGKGWRAVKLAALERDGYQCRLCGRTKEEIGRNPDVHHITPVREFIESDDHEKEEAHTLPNVVTLCTPCHRKADFGHIAPETLREWIADSADAPDP